MRLRSALFALVVACGGGGEPAAPEGNGRDPAAAAPPAPALAGWRIGPPLPAAGARFAGVLGDALYVVLPTDVQVARLGAGGAPDAWSPAGPLGDQVAGLDATFTLAGDGARGWLVASGVRDMYGGFHEGEVHVARVGGGTVGPFVATRAYAPGGAGAATVAAGDDVYALGGQWWSGGSFTGVGAPLALVHRAALEGDGAVGPWRAEPLLPRAGTWRAVAHRRWIYALGWHGDGVDAFRAERLPGGGLGPWRRLSAQPEVAAGASFAVAADGAFLHVVHAEPREVTGETVYVLTTGRVGPDGDVEAWERSTAGLVAPGTAHGGPRLAARGGRLYLVPGAGAEVRWAVVDPASGRIAPPADGPRPPSAPRRVRAAPVDGGARVTWEPPADDGGAAVTGYTVWRGSDGATVEVGPGAREVVLGGLENLAAASAAHYQVRARSAAGAGAASGPTDDVVPSPTRRWRASAHGAPWSRPLFEAGGVLYAAGPRGAALPLDAAGLPWARIGPGWEGSSPVLWGWALAARGDARGETCAYAVGGLDHGWTVGDAQVLCPRGGAFGLAGLRLGYPAQDLRDATYRSSASAAVAGDLLLVAGGEQVVGYDDVLATLDDVSFARIGSDGALGEWQRAAPLPEPMVAPALAARGEDLFVLHGRQLLRSVRGAAGAPAGWAPSGPPLDVDAPGARMVVEGGRLYLLAPGVLRIATFDGAGDVAGWEDDPAGALPLERFELTAARGRLYVSGGALLVARLDPATGRLVDWE